MLIATLIFLFTITLVIWQPKGLSVGWSAVLGAGLALLTGVVHLSDIAVVWGHHLECHCHFHFADHHHVAAG